MRAQGFYGLFTRKRHQSSSEGLATFVRRSSFQIVEARALPLSMEGQDRTAGFEPILDCHTGTADAIATLPTVAQLVLLREVSPSPPPRSPELSSRAARSPARQLLVANTHLYFANPAMHVISVDLKQLHAALPDDSID